MRHILIAFGSLLALYLVAGGLVFGLMHQPPERFAAAISHVPGPVFAALPFKKMWLFSRRGSLQIGDPAPDFTLDTLDRKGTVQLSAFRGKSPVVLVFGSYT
jgi:hypothetical protein